MEATDAELIAASLNDPRAFVGIFERHFESISRYLRRRLSRMVADDLAAEVFATAFSRRFAFDLNRPDALPWLYGIAANLLRARARTEQRELHALARTGIDPVGAGVSDAALGSALEPVLAVLPTDVVNAADRWPVAERAVWSLPVVVVEPVWQGAVAVSM